MSDAAAAGGGLKDVVGKRTSHSRVVIERAPVGFFAQAVLSDSPIYQNPEAAKAAGLPNIPAPPTFPFGFDAWGKYEEIQPEDKVQGNPLMAALGPLMAKGGIILHGEQEFVYHRPVFVGDVLTGEGRVVDAYEKDSKGRTMTFIVSETNWVDDKSGETVVTSRTNLIHRA
jgi:hypothetical protein